MWWLIVARVIWSNLLAYDSQTHTSFGQFGRTARLHLLVPAINLDLICTMVCGPLVNSHAYVKVPHFLCMFARIGSPLVNSYA